MKKTLIWAGVMSAAAWAQPLSLKISEESVPPGGVAQIKLFVTEPKPITSGTTKFSFEEAYFEDVLGIALHSPAGDAVGTAVRDAGQLRFQILSPRGGFGTGLDYPVLTVAARLRSDLPVGKAVSIDFSAPHFVDPFGLAYAMELKPGRVTAEGRVSIDNVVPGGGALPAGAEVRIIGRGFDEGVRVQINETRLDSVTRVSGTEIRVKLAEAADLTGRRLRVINRGGSGATYYSYLRATRLGRSANPLLEAVYPLFSNQASGSALLPVAAGEGQGFFGLAIENPGALPVTAAIEFTPFPFGSPVSTEVTLPAYGVVVRELKEWLADADGSTPGVLRIDARAPVHVLGLRGAVGAAGVFPVPPTPGE